MSDPWLTNEKTDQSPVIDNKFEDNFALETQITQNNFNEFNSLPKLPDSENYLQGLERKLEKLKKGSNLIKALSEKRQDCLRSLLNEDINGIQNNNEKLVELDAPVNSESAVYSTVYRHLQPVQPISVGETVHIVKYDQLEEQQKVSETADEEQETPDI